MQRLNENIMQNVEQNTPLANNHISVDCVVIGFDGEQLKSCWLNVPEKKRVKSSMI